MKIGSSLAMRVWWVTSRLGCAAKLRSIRRVFLLVGQLTVGCCGYEIYDCWESPAARQSYYSTCLMLDKRELHDIVMIYTCAATPMLRYCRIIYIYIYSLDSLK